eukprot:4492427-Alexandrium_andersonii.AAC.1
MSQPAMIWWLHKRWPRRWLKKYSRPETARVSSARVGWQWDFRSTSKSPHSTGASGRSACSRNQFA